MPSIINLSPIWEHTLREILNHGNKTEVGIIMRSWVKHNTLEDMSDLLIYDLNDFTPGGTTLCHYKETAEAPETKLMPNTPLKELYNLYRYIQHLILESEFEYDEDEFDNPLDEGNWLLQARGKYMKFVIYHSSTATEPRNTSNHKLVSFRKGIKREETACPTLKDERYFDSFSRSLYVTAKSHECEDVLDPEYTPPNSEKELFEAKQVFMFSVLDKHLLTDMGKTIVRKYVHTTDAQSVWKDFQEHMKSSSKGASEKRRLTQYVTNTTLDDNYKGTTEQFVLHFNEQFRQLEEISEESEHFPPQIKLQLLQNAVRPINDLRIVETLDEYQSITSGYGRSSSLKYQTYYDLLINACVRYDRTKKSNIAKEVISIKQPSHKAMIILSAICHLTLQLVIHTWVLIHLVKNFTISIPINLAHLCLLDINSNPDYKDQTQMQNLIHSPRNRLDKNGLDQYICQVIYIIF